MNYHNPSRETYDRDSALRALKCNLADAINSFFADEDEGKVSNESVTIIVNGKVFTFPMEPALTNALFEFIDSELKEV